MALCQKCGQNESSREDRLCTKCAQTKSKEIKCSCFNFFGNIQCNEASCDCECHFF
jgi:hypothetical protein